VIVSAVAIKGGVGKSTLCAHLAGWFHQKGAGVVLVDADPQLASTRWLAEALPQLRVEQAFGPDELLDKISALQQATDHVVVDGPPGATEASRAILLSSDLALLPCGPSVLDLRALRDTALLAHRCQKIRGGPPDLLAVLNRMRPHERVSIEILQAVGSLQIPLAKTIIRQRTVIADSVGQGRLLFQLGAPAREPAHDMHQLFEEVIHHGQTKRTRLPDRRQTKVPLRDHQRLPTTESRLRSPFSTDDLSSPP